jgi:hypothetical protein
MQLTAGSVIKCITIPRYKFEQPQDEYYLIVEEEICEEIPNSDKLHRDIRYNIIDLGIGGIVWCTNLAPKTLEELRERLSKYLIIDEVKEWNCDVKVHIRP